MAKNIICPKHNDTNPSMTVYEKYSHCWVCGYHVKNSELGEKNETFSKKEPEKIEASLEYIQNLPVKWVRGLEFPCDDVGYYIVWPCRSYFKRRNFKGKQRYSGPKGIRQPLFIYPNNKDHVVVIEGEINAISVWYSHTNVCPEHTICSMGAASNLSRFIPHLLTYKKITLIMDNDGPGVVYGSEVKEELLKAGKYCNLVTVDTDYNDLLQSGGTDLVLKQFKKDIYG